MKLRYNCNMTSNAHRQLRNNAGSKTPSLPLLCVCCVFSIAIFTFDIQVPTGVCAGLPYLLIVLASMRFDEPQAPATAAGICTALTFLGWHFSPHEGIPWVVAMNRYMTIMAIWVTASLSRFIKLNLQNRIDQLESILTVCSYCGKIRNQTGKWISIEEHLLDESRTAVSHGLCGDCYETELRSFAETSESHSVHDGK